MTTFTAGKAIRVPVTQDRFIDEDKLPTLATLPGFAKKGCYVFSLKASKGELPIYVGMTQKLTLFKEAFNSKNKIEIAKYLHEHNGHLYISLVYEEDGKLGKPNLSAIRDIEGFLIGLCVKRNADLINKQKTKGHSWSIKGVVESGKGKPPTAAVRFRKLIGA